MVDNDELAWECKPHPFEEEDTPDGFIGRSGVEFIEGYDRSQPFYLNSAKLDRQALALLPVVASLEQAEDIWGRFRT